MVLAAIGSKRAGARNQAQLEELLVAAGEASRAKSLFLADVSHDMRMPVMDELTATRNQ